MAVASNWRGRRGRQRGGLDRGVSLWVIASSLIVALGMTVAIDRGDIDAPVTGRTGKTTTEIANAVARATVAIRASLPGNVISAGSGFVVDASGTIVTNAHVVDGARRVEVRLSNGDVYEVSGVRGIDRRRDIAVLQIPAYGLPTVSLGDSDVVRAGDHVVVIGNALGVLDNTVTAGVISGVRNVGGYRLFQMDAAISKGNSGGPVVNEAGEVVGITVAKIEAGESLNFAIPVNYARGLLQLGVKEGLGELQGGNLAGETLFGGEAQKIPRRWKSLMSGTTKIVRVDGDYVYVETVLPEEVKALGGMIMAELKKKGDRWVGTIKSRVPCRTGDGVWTKIRLKICEFEEPMEITLLSASRIEGTVMEVGAGARFNCRRCSYSKRPTKEKFAWIPE